VYTVLGFSLGWLAWGALVALVNAVVALVVIAFWFYTSLALLGALVFSGIGIRRVIARRIRQTSPAEVSCSPLDITPPIVVVDGPDCKFYRSAAAVMPRLTLDTKVFDAQGYRLVGAGSRLRVSATNPDGAQELAELLRGWLGYMDAIRWSTADMELPLLLQASTEHLGYSDG
jgi:hypothetical protein